MEIIVKAWGETVAKLREKNGINYFSLSPNSKLNFSPIKLTQKAKDYEFSHLLFQNGLPGVINDSLPGVYGKEYLDTFFLKHFKYKPSYLETLQFLGDNTMGALTYEPSLKHDISRQNIILEAQELYSESKKAILGDAEFSINEIIAISNSAASGARPKAIVGFNPNTNKMFVGEKLKSLPIEYIHSIVKFDTPLDKNSVEIKGEYIYSLLAKQSGIEMSQTYLVESDGSYHFVVERFDIKSIDGLLDRKHMHSLSGILHQNPAETTFDYTNLFRVGDRLNIPHADKEQFFKTMLFNLIFGNRDDHTRNFSYLMDSEGKWRGSPAYDLTFAYKEKHQMLFDYKNAYTLKINDIVKIADDFGIDGAKETIELMLDLKHSSLKELSSEYDLKEWYGDIIDATKKILVE